MNKLFKVLGWLLAVLGTISFLLALLVLVLDDPNTKGAFAGFVMFGLMFGLPGAVLLWRLKKAEATTAFRTQVLGYIKSFDVFTVPEMAGKVGRSEMETEALIANLIAKENLNLGFHRPTRRYLHRDRIKETHYDVQRCPSCGADLGRQVVFPGEDLVCQYCDKVIPPPSSSD